MILKNHTRIDLAQGGNIFKQGDYVDLAFTPRDAAGKVVDLAGKQIEVAIWNRSKGVIYQDAASWDATDKVIRIKIEQALDHGKFQIEFTVTDSTDSDYRMKFPSDEYNGVISITPSTDNLDVVGVQMMTVEKFREEFDQALNALPVDSEINLARVATDGTVYPNLPARLSAEQQATATQLAEMLRKTDTGVLDLNVFDEPTRAALQGLSEGQINAVLGFKNVKPENMSILEVVGANSFNKNSASAGFIVSKTNGTNVAVAGYNASDFILVNEGQIWNTTRIYDYAYYDIDKVFISGGSGGGSNNTLTIPANAVFLRVTVRNDALDGAMVVRGSLPSSYVPFGQYNINITDGAFQEAIRQIAAGEITPPPSAPQPWEDDRVFMFGDSITYWDKREAWFEAGYMIKGLGSYIEERLGATVYNFGVGGNTAKQVSDRVVNANLATVTDILTYSAGTNDSTDSGVVLGTIDDLYTQDTFYGNVKRAVRHVYMQNPKIKMYFITPHRSERPVKPFVDALVELGKFYGIPTFNAYEEVQVNEFTESTYLVDGVHFYNEGYELFADRLIPFLTTN